MGRGIPRWVTKTAHPLAVAELHSWTMRALDLAYMFDVEPQTIRLWATGGLRGVVLGSERYAPRSRRLYRMREVIEFARRTSRPIRIERLSAEHQKQYFALTNDDATVVE